MTYQIKRRYDRDGVLFTHSNDFPWNGLRVPQDRQEPQDP